MVGCGVVVWYGVYGSEPGKGDKRGVQMSVRGALGQKLNLCNER